ncbi:sensor histidine kinase [Actinoplanes octamycinicus]|uniref:sensor histidine kinase n=1 Tax=Actinoplanes octamycinicus TaxID=135948 RepID=UPI001C8890A8|nr:sensor histidine kinase [Actinoplanes octamycinicus]
MIYGAVLAGGVYWELTGDSSGQPIRLIGFVAVIALLFALETVLWRRPPASTTAAAGLLVVRVLLFVAASALDGSGTARALIVLVPFLGYFAFGRPVAIALAGGCVALVVTGYTVRTPGWYRDAAYVSDLLMISIGLVLAVAMAAVAVAERGARARLERMLERVAELSTTTERNRLARDIHDSLGHHLTAISIQLEKASAFIHRDPALAEQALLDARSSAKHALSEVRRSVGALRDEPSGFSLRAALTELSDSVDDGLTVTVDITGEPDRHDAASLTALYRAAQEALTNARRHARAGRVSVAVTFDEAGARLVVADDGCGLAAAGERQRAGGDPPGFGLLGMRERVQLLGGEVSIDSPRDAGTVLTVTIPRPAAVVGEAR